MVWAKRVSFFFMVNLGIIIMLSAVMNLLGLGPYLSRGGGNQYSALFLFCLLWGTGGAFISLWISKWIAKRAYGVQMIDVSSGEFAWIVSAVHSMSRKAKLPVMPEVGVYDSPEMNAFATGPSNKNSMVAVSTGLLEKMDRDEIEGVLGHEVAHIANGDMVTMTLLQGVMNAFVMFFARIAAQILDSFLRSDEESEGIGFFGYMLTVMVFELIFGLLGQMITSYFSRIREYRADAGSARLVGRQKMVSALEALGRDRSTMEAVRHNNAGLAALQISSKSQFLQLFSTHPPLDKRLSRLRSGS